MLTYEVLKERYASIRKSHNDIFNELIRVDKENKHLNQQLDRALKDYDKLQQRIDKAIEYIKNEDWNTEYDSKLLMILQGETNE